MKPTEFKGQNTLLGKGQPEYTALPALHCYDEQGTVWSCWELDDADIADLLRTRKLWVGQLTFGRLFAPTMVSAVMPGEVSMAAHKSKKEDV